MFIQYVLYSLRSLQKHRLCVNGDQSNLQTSKIIPRRDSAPRFLNSWIRHWLSISFLRIFVSTKSRILQVQSVWKLYDVLTKHSCFKNMAKCNRTKAVKQRMWFTSSFSFNESILIIIYESLGFTSATSIQVHLNIENADFGIPPFRYIFHRTNIYSDHINVFKHVK